MTDVRRLKDLDPKLYKAILDFESDIYMSMHKKTSQISKVRDLMLDGDMKAAWLLFRDIKNSHKIRKNKKPRA